MRILLQPSFVLHQRAYRDTSLLLDLFTRDYGRIALVAHGARSARSRMSPILQPFVPLLVSWQGKGELKTLVAVEAVGAPLQLHGNCLLSSFYLNEILVRALQKEDPFPALYSIYQQALFDLQGKVVHEHILRLFEKKLLAQLGYALQLQQDFATGVPIIEERSYHFYPEQGFTLSESDVLGGFKGKSLLALAEEKLEGLDTLRDAKRLMRLALAALLGIEAIESRKLFQRE